MTARPPRSHGLRRRAACVASAVLALAFATSAAPAIAAPPGPSVDGIGATAVDQFGKPTEDAYFVAERNAGSRLVGHIEISNGGSQYARLRIDPVDALTSARGGTVFAARDTPKRGVGSWITTTKELVRLEPGEKKTISFEVRIPGDARAGDHVGGIAIEPLRRRTSGGQFAITQVQRVAIATQLIVRGDAHRHLTPEILRLGPVADFDVPALFVRLANDGELLCKPTVVATLKRDGKVVSSERRAVDTVLAKTAIDYPVYWPRGLRAGSYQALVRTYGCGTPAETSADVTLGEDLSGTTPPASTRIVTPPPTGGSLTSQLAVGVPIGLLLLASGWGLARVGERRRRIRERRLRREARAAADA